MGKAQIIEGNKLIAEFMGAKEGNPKGRKNKVYINVPIWNRKKMQTWTMTANDLQYDSSWNWLMPVVEKINKLEDGIYKIIISAYYSGTRLGDDKLFNDKYDTPIIQTHKAVVEFIKQYNENKK